MTDRELMQQALEALEIANGMLEWRGIYHADIDQAIAALRERLSQPEQEPPILTALNDRAHPKEQMTASTRPLMRRATREEKIDRPGVYWVPVEQPEQKRPQNCGTSYCSCVECVMEPNTKVNSEAIPKQISEPEQEPVAWLYRDSWGTMKLSQVMPPPVGAFPVYTTPPQPDIKVNFEAIPKQIFEPEQEPVAHLWQHSETGRTRIVMPDQIVTADASWFVVGPLYLGTPSRREWVGLTEEEIDGVKHTFDWASPWTLADFASAIEAKLREKNA